MLFIAALASKVVLSTPTVLPATSPFTAAIASTNWNTSSNTSAGSLLRVFVNVEWSGLGSSSASPKNSRRPRLSPHRHAIPRWLSIPSK